MARRIRTVIFLLVGLLAAWSDPARAQLQGQVIRIGIGAPLTGGAATFGVEMKNAVELAIEEQNSAGGVLGARLEAVVFDDEASDAKGQAGAGALCQDPAVLAVVGHANSNVSITASNMCAGCGRAMLTPMSSKPGVTDRGLANVFRLTNRDDHKGPGLAAYLYRRVGKRRAVWSTTRPPTARGWPTSSRARSTRRESDALHYPQVRATPALLDCIQDVQPRGCGG